MASSTKEVDDDGQVLDAEHSEVLRRPKRT